MTEPLEQNRAPWHRRRRAYSRDPPRLVKALATGKTYASIGDGRLAFPTVTQTVAGLGAGREPSRRGFDIGA
jgi:hypothetical protein